MLERVAIVVLDVVAWLWLVVSVLATVYTFPSPVCLLWPLIGITGWAVLTLIASLAARVLLGR